MITAASILAMAVFAQPPAPGHEAADRSAGHDRSRQLLELYAAEAAGYTIYHDAARKEEVELRREPVYVWNNRVRGGGQDGAVYVWTCRGRIEVVGSIFSEPQSGPRTLYHEFHSLSLSTLDVSRSPEANRWTPRAPGVKLTAIDGAPTPAHSAPQRLAQMRALAREFSARTRDREEREWELRLLPQPLYRYESTDPDVLDGAVFAFVTSMGTDPEAILALEARKPASGGEPPWNVALARFTDLTLWVRHKGTVVFTAEYIHWDAVDHDGLYRYHVFKDRVIPAIGEARP